jgi:hypothetical protein
MAIVLFAGLLSLVTIVGLAVYISAVLNDIV